MRKKSLSLFLFSALFLVALPTLGIAEDTWTVSGDNLSSRPCMNLPSVGVPNFQICGDSTCSGPLLNTIVDDGTSNGQFFLQSYPGGLYGAMLDTGNTIYLVDPNATSWAGIWQPSPGMWFFSIPSTSLIDGAWHFDTTDMNQAAMPTNYQMTLTDACQTNLTFLLNSGGGASGEDLNPEFEAANKERQSTMIKELQGQIDGTLQAD